MIHSWYQIFCMKTNRLLTCMLVFCFFAACKSTVKKQNDKVYSRHLQRYVDLTIIATKMPDKKEEMNLLLLINNDLISNDEAKNIIDSLYKNKKIQPILLVSFAGKEGDYGLEEMEVPQTKQYKKFNNFVVNELYPFIKKKTVIRKFNSVAVAGLGNGALSSFDIAWNNDEKISKAGMFETDFGTSEYKNDSLTLNTIEKLRKRPNLKLWLTANNSDSSVLQFKKSMDGKKSITECTITASENATEQRRNSFASFLVWAFAR